MVLPKPTNQRYLDLGSALFFRPEALDPAANQIRVRSGFLLRGAFAIESETADQLTAGFAIVAAGQRRYDLVYIDATGMVQILQGTPLAAAQPAFEGAPGWTGANPGPLVPDGAIPVAWVLAGGYTKDVSKVVEVHVNTFRAFRDR